jgi:hypothetical protein
VFDLLARDVHVTLDGWRSKANREYFAVVAHFIDQFGKLHCYLMGVCFMPDGHAHQECYSMLDTIFTKFGIRDKVLSYSPLSPCWVGVLSVSTSLILLICLEYYVQC